MTVAIPVDRKCVLPAALLLMIICPLCPEVRPEQEQKALGGPSALTGVEICKGGFGSGGALGMSCVATSREFLEQKIALSFDTSFGFHF